MAGFFMLKVNYVALWFFLKFSHLPEMKILI